jgi:hypothetical protein
MFSEDLKKKNTTFHEATSPREKLAICLDGRHVVIEASANSGLQYFSYRKMFSIMLLALVDAHYKFIVVGSYGKNSNAGIFSNLKVGKALERKKLNIPEDKPLPGTTESLLTTYNSWR